MPPQPAPVGEGLPAPGDLAKYDIQRRIGSGKFSVVYRAKRLADKSVCALKKIQVFDIKDEKSRTKCLQEVKLLEALRHEHIVRYYDSFIEEGVLFIVFEWAAGGDLKAVIREAERCKSPLDEGVVWSYFRQMSEGLQHMHDLRMMHRDIKPANLFITGSGVVKLGDMGLGRQLSEESVAAFSKVGTPLYMSPELLKGDGYDLKSDIWSLGCVLYEMAKLRSPFKTDDQNLYALFQRITTCEYPPLDEGLSKDLRDLVAQMVQIESAQRPDMHECSRIAAANAHKFRARRSVYVTCEEVSYMLQLLDYGERFCAIRRRPPLSRMYFAAAAHTIAGEENGGEKAQFWVFIDLVHWLLALIQGQKAGEPYESRGQHELAVIAAVVDQCRKVPGVATDFPPNRLLLGHGETVCSLLYELAQQALDAEQFGWRRHDAVESDGNERHTGASEVEEDESFINDLPLAAPADDSLDSGEQPEYAEPEPLEGSRSTWEDRNAMIASTLTAGQVEQWREEGQRLAAEGQLTAAPRLTLGGQGGWQVHWLALEAAATKVLTPAQSAMPGLRAVSEALDVEREALLRAERVANEGCGEQVGNTVSTFHSLECCRPYCAPLLACFAVLMH